MTRLRPLLRAFGAVSCTFATQLALGAAPSKPTLVSGSASNGGGVLTAGPDGAAYALPSLARIKLAPNAQVRIFPVPQSLQLAPGAKTTTWSFALLNGRVDVEVPQKPRSAVLASVGKLSTIVAGGGATLLTHDGDTIVANGGGLVRTLLNEHWQTIEPGSLSRFDDRHPSGELAATIAPPALSPGHRIWLAAGSAVSVAGVRWKPVDRAHGYELRLLSADGSIEQLQLFSAAEQQRPFAPLEAGQYFLSGRSIDMDGIAGSWSQAQPLRVLGVQLPPGGYVENGAIVIGPTQEVRFSHTDGLEMTYQGAGSFVAASNALTLYRGETTIVNFRIPGSPDTTTARLEPRGIYATVSLGPTRALWPRDAVTVEVEMKSKNGDPVPPWLELKPDVLLGIDKLDVTFSHEGSRWFATVPPSDKPGPWVLRVEVKDQFGGELGRDFLEIAPAPKPTLAALAKPVPSKVSVEPPKSEPPVASK